MTIATQLGQGFRALDLDGLALFVEITLGGCVYLVLDLRDGRPIVESRSNDSETGKIAAVGAALRYSFGQDHGRDPAFVAHSLSWYRYPL